MANGADFWGQIRRLLQHYQPATPTVQVPSAQPTAPQTMGTPNLGALSQAEKVGLIIEAAKRGVMIRMLYGGEWRFVEPYSFRDKGHGRLFYGFCRAHPRHLDGHTASFKVERIQEVELALDHPYSPRWPVELK